MVDKSTSLNSTEFDKSLQFVHDVIQLLDIGQSDTLASLVTVSTPPTEIFDLKDYTDKSDYLQDINDLMGKATATLNAVLTLCGKNPLKPVPSIGPTRNRKEWSYCCQALSQQTMRLALLRSRTRFEPTTMPAFSPLVSDLRSMHKTQN